LLAGDATVTQGLPHLPLVAIALCRIDMSVSELQRPAHHGQHFFSGELPGAKPQSRHALEAIHTIVAHAVFLCGSRCSPEHGLSRPFWGTKLSRGRRGG